MNPRSMTLRHLARARSPLRVPALRGRHSSRAARFAWTAPRATYVICTTPRSGSWLLSDGLSSTGVAGRPREWFNVLEEQQHYARWRMAHDTDLGFHRYLQLARLHLVGARADAGDQRRELGLRGGEVGGGVHGVRSLTGDCE